MSREIPEIAPTIQSGVLAYRMRDEHLEILLVKKHRSLNWGIPKGKLEPNLDLRENAAKEAFEEAGVRGNIGSDALGSYRAMKRILDREILIEVWVFLLEVSSIAEQWPEQDTRVAEWFSAKEAIKHFREPILVSWCERLAEAKLKT